MIGTSLVIAGPSRAALLCRLLRNEFFVNLELHGIDLCAPDDPGLGSLRGHQPDAAVPLARKQETLAAVIRQFRETGAEFVTLAEAAELAFQKPLKS